MADFHSDPDHDRSWLRERLQGELGSASDRDLDAHLLVCDRCLGSLLLRWIGVSVPSTEPVTA